MATPLSKYIRRAKSPINKVLDPISGAVNKVADPLRQVSAAVSDPITDALSGGVVDPLTNVLSGGGIESNVSPVQQAPNGNNFLGQTEVELDRNILDKIGGFIGGIKPTLRGQGSTYRSLRAGEREGAVRALNKERITALAKDARSVSSLIKLGDIQGATNILNSRMSAIQKLGGDPSDTQEIMDMINSGNVKGAVNDLDLAVSRAKERGFLSKTGQPISTSSLTQDGKILTQGDDGSFSLTAVKGFDEESTLPTSFTFGASSTFKDEKGNMFLSTQRRDPKTGSLTALFAPLVEGGPNKPVGKVEMVGSYGLTAGEYLTQAGAVAGTQETSKLGAQAINAIKKSGFAARTMIPDTERMIKLNNMINTGGGAETKKYFQSVFNLKSEDAANLADFNALSGKMILGQIRQLGANPTEGERKFLEQITASIENGTVINEALLNDVLQVQQRQLARARLLASNPGMTLDDLLLIDEEDFNPTGDYSNVGGQFQSFVPENSTQEVGGGTPPPKNYNPEDFGKITVSSRN